MHESRSSLSGAAVSPLSGISGALAIVAVLPVVTAPTQNKWASMQG